MIDKEGKNNDHHHCYKKKQWKKGEHLTLSMISLII